MAYKINEQEIQSVSGLDSLKRYEHFLKRVADWQELWTLKSDGGFVMMGDDAGNEGSPFWPHPRYAEAHVRGDWADCKPVQITLSDFMEKWLRGMEKDRLKIIVFPTPLMRGIMVEPARIRDDLSEELKRYE